MAIKGRMVQIAQNVENGLAQFIVLRRSTMKRVDRYQAVQVKLNDAMSAALDLEFKGEELQAEYVRSVAEIEMLGEAISSMQEAQSYLLKARLRDEEPDQNP